MNLFTQHYSASQASPFKKGRVTCPICGNTHRYHCSVTVDGMRAICKNKWSERQAKDGRYIHLLQDKSPSPFSTQQTAATATNIREYRFAEHKRADAEQLHAVYSTLLSRLELAPTHGDDLLQRGLSDTAIAANLYASVPDKEAGARQARALARIYDLTGVPGFYRRNGRWQVNDCCKGYYIPYRNHLGRIMGLQIRLDDTSNGKYRWLSSKGFPDGTA
ncbi:MAG TPA: hypothetical protein VNA19_06340, partial [Pyrinomonadaceae bacterium]|nr:hypothetical protein [Pyrinomonadaceae bacterium]